MFYSLVIRDKYEVRNMNLALVFIVVIAIMSTFAIVIIWVARQNNFSAKQTIDSMPAEQENEQQQK